jgi:hypothetical protein
MKWPGWPWVAVAFRTLSPVALSVFAGALVFVLWKGGWPIETAEARVQWLGISLLLLLVALILSLFLTPDGIRSFSVKAGIIEAGINNDGNQPDRESGS